MILARNSARGADALSSFGVRSRTPALARPSDRARSAAIGGVVATARHCDRLRRDAERTRLACDRADVGAIAIELAGAVPAWCGWRQRRAGGDRPHVDGDD